MEIGCGTLQAGPRRCLMCVCRGAPREAQRGLEKPREPQRGTEMHREARRGPERPLEAYTQHNNKNSGSLQMLTRIYMKSNCDICVHENRGQRLHCGKCKCCVLLMLTDFVLPTPSALRHLSACKCLHMKSVCIAFNRCTRPMNHDDIATQMSRVVFPSWQKSQQLRCS